MMGIKFIKKTTSMMNKGNPSEELPEEADGAEELISFEIEEIIIEHFREEDLSHLMSCV